MLATEFLKGHKFKIKEGHCYLGGYLGSTELTEGYVAEKVEDCVDAVTIFAEMMPVFINGCFLRYFFKKMTFLLDY